ncbi:MAG: DUF6184 family natural product biosynthesis lipoprotein [Polyangiaceae bacterium]|jgi:hypothetical protein
MKLLTAACLLLVTAACEQEGPPPPRTPYPLTDPQPQPNAQAAADFRVIEHIASATCDREQSCGTIGPGGYFESREQCMKTMRDKLDATLGVSQCPAGLDLKAVEACLSSLEANQCAQPGDAITRAARCPPAELCMK